MKTDQIRTIVVGILSDDHDISPEQIDALVEVSSLVINAREREILACLRASCCRCCDEPDTLYEDVVKGLAELDNGE